MVRQAPGFIQPEPARNDVISLVVEGGLRDILSITRPRSLGGIPCRAKSPTFLRLVRCTDRLSSAVGAREAEFTRKIGIWHAVSISGKEYPLSRRYWPDLMAGRASRCQKTSSGRHGWLP